MDSISRSATRVEGARVAPSRRPVVTRDVVMQWMKFFQRHGLTCYLNLTDEATLRLRLAALPEHDIPEELVQNAYLPRDDRELRGMDGAYAYNEHAHTEQRPRAADGSAEPEATPAGDTSDSEAERAPASGPTRRGAPPRRASRTLRRPETSAGPDGDTPMASAPPRIAASCQVVEDVVLVTLAFTPTSGPLQLRDIGLTLGPKGAAADAVEVAVVAVANWLAREGKRQIRFAGLSLRGAVLLNVGDHKVYEESTPWRRQIELVQQALASPPPAVLLFQVPVGEGVPSVSPYVTGVSPSEYASSQTMQCKAAAATASLQGKDPLLAMIHTGEFEPSYGNPRLFEGAYPHLFPGGAGGPEDECEAIAALEPGEPRRKRPIKLSFNKWGIANLLHSSGAFARDTHFMWSFNDMDQVRCVTRNARFMIRGNHNSETIAHMVDVFKKAYDPPEDATPDQILDWKIESSKFDRKLQLVGAKSKGSPYERRALRANIMGGILRWGPNCLYLTVNPSDGYDVRSIYCCDGALKIALDVPVPSKLRRAQMCSANPVGSALYFNKVIKDYIRA